MISTQLSPVRSASADRDVVTVGAVRTPMGAFGAVFTSTGLAQLAFPEDSRAYSEEWATRLRPAGFKLRPAGFRLRPAGFRLMPHAEISHDSEMLPASVRSLQADALSEQLTAYLEGNLRVFSIPLDLRGTPFQLEVWRALQAIGYGELRSYGDVARTIGRPTAVRAVGAANGANPVPIIVPCHRVIGSNRTLTGYGGGMEMKERLLRLEGALL